MKVLVVDDDQDQLSVRCMLIELHGFETERAIDAGAAARLARSQHIDVAIVDIHLPTLPIGLKLLRELRALLPKIRLIAITGTEPEALRNYPDLGIADELVVKGSSSKALLSSLKRLAEQRAV